MEIHWHKNAWDDFVYWKKNDARMLKKINKMIKECMITPFSGKGNPRQLKGILNNYWSRRIDDEHRIVYRIIEGNLVIVQCKFH